MGLLAVVPLWDIITSRLEIKVAYQVA